MNVTKQFLKCFPERLSAICDIYLLWFVQSDTMRAAVFILVTLLMVVASKSAPKPMNMKLRAAKLNAPETRQDDGDDGEYSDDGDDGGSGDYELGFCADGTWNLAKCQCGDGTMSDYYCDDFGCGHDCGRKNLPTKCWCEDGTLVDMEADKI